MQARSTFERMRQVAKDRLQGLEHYSTVLWQLRQEVCLLPALIFFVLLLRPTLCPYPVSQPSIPTLPTLTPVVSVHGLCTCDESAVLFTATSGLVCPPFVQSSGNAPVSWRCCATMLWPW